MGVLTIANIRTKMGETGELDVFCSQHLFERVPFIFGNDSTSYIQWKTLLAGQLYIDARDIVIVGSAAVGFSLNPDKNLKVFDNESDVDVAVLSQRHFDMAWRHLRNLGSQAYRMLPEEQEAVKSHRKHYIYFGVIATDRILGHLPFGREWLTALESMGGIDPTSGRVINARLYHDSDALRSYHVAGLKKLRERLEPTTE